MRYNLTFLSRQILTAKNSKKHFAQFILNNHVIVNRTTEINKNVLNQTALYLPRRHFCDTHNSCWKCNSKNTEKIFCKECGALQKIDKHIVSLIYVEVERSLS